MQLQDLYNKLSHLESQKQNIENEILQTKKLIEQKYDISLVNKELGEKKVYSIEVVPFYKWIFAEDNILE